MSPEFGRHEEPTTFDWELAMVEERLEVALINFEHARVTFEEWSADADVDAERLEIAHRNRIEAGTTYTQAVKDFQHLVSHEKRRDRMV